MPAFADQGFRQPQPLPQLDFFFGRTSLKTNSSSVKVTMPAAVRVCQSGCMLETHEFTHLENNQRRGVGKAGHE